MYKCKKAEWSGSKGTSLTLADSIQLAENLMSTVARPGNMSSIIPIYNDGTCYSGRGLPSRCQQAACLGYKDYCQHVVSVSPLQNSPTLPPTGLFSFLIPRVSQLIPRQLELGLGRAMLLGLWKANAVPGKLSPNGG